MWPERVGAVDGTSRTSYPGLAEVSRAATAGHDPRAVEESPATLPSACAAPALGSSRACASVEVRSRRRAPRQPAAATRHARGRSARRPPRSAGTPAADHAAALWQLCCRIGTTTTIACQVVDSRARCHRVQMATIAERGANAGTAQPARGGRRAYTANRHRVCIGTRSCVRCLTISIAISAAFGHGTRTRTLSRTLTGREASKCAPGEI